jgi:tagatose-1,6-bisphosphate aldolase non-catalytic subunit AgaZ/GatZ
MFRYEVPLDDKAHHIDLSRGVQIAPTAEVTVSEVDRTARLSFWAEHDGDRAADARLFRVFGTGHQIPPGATWRATAPRIRGMVFHLYEVLD